MKKVYPFSRLTIRHFIMGFVREIKGLENIPEKPFIVACNHSSFIDDFIVPAVIVFETNKKLHQLVNDSYYLSYFLRKFFNHYECIPVSVNKNEDSKRINEEALAKAKYYLEKGENVGIYPEGHRSIDGKLLKAKTGVARLALLAKVPVLPMGIIDSWKILPKGKFFPRFKRCTVKIGKPVYFDYKEINKDILNKVTTSIMKNIATLICQKYTHD